MTRGRLLLSLKSCEDRCLLVIRQEGKRVCVVKDAVQREMQRKHTWLHLQRAFFSGCPHTNTPSSSPALSHICLPYGRWCRCIPEGPGGEVWPPWRRLQWAAAAVHAAGCACRWRPWKRRWSCRCTRGTSWRTAGAREAPQPHDATQNKDTSKMPTDWALLHRSSGESRWERNQPPSSSPSSSSSSQLPVIHVTCDQNLKKKKKKLLSISLKGTGLIMTLTRCHAVNDDPELVCMRAFLSTSAAAYTDVKWERLLRSWPCEWEGVRFIDMNRY